MPKITAQQRKDIDSLIKRLRQRGFSWQHEDYFLLREALPVLAKHVEADYPVLRILEDHLLAGAYLANQDECWCLFGDDGEEIVSGETMQELLENLIWRDC